MANRNLEHFRAPRSLQLALAWAALMFLYIYNDYFSLYRPGAITRMAEGRLAFGPATEGALVAVSLLLAIPALMIFLSVALAPLASRWLNILFGLAYTAIEALTFMGSPLFYQIVVALEIALTLAIVWLALRWPRAPA